MTGTDTASPRAKLVEGLWQLKQVAEQQDDQGLRHLHFNTLLKDPDYRLDIIRRASSSRHPAISRLARELQILDRPEILISRSSTNSSRRPLAPDKPASQLHQATHQNAQQGFVGIEKQSPPQMLVPGLLVLILILSATATWLLRDALGLSNQRISVSGSLFGDQRWTADKQWLLEGIVYLESGARLIIEPGTEVLGKNGSALVITRDATLHARGTLDSPIVFTSAMPVGQRKPGDWGGLVMLGNAPVNVADARIEGIPEGDTRAAFGGVDPTANCGVLEYARIEFAGFEAYANNELNGLTLGGCGSNTIVRHVQVHRGLDDGIEIFGGNVDLKYILITGAGDDSLDWDMGWRGRAQFLIVQQHPGVGDNAFEGDNNRKNHLATPRSEPKLSNVTLLSSGQADKFQRAMTLRRGTGGHFKNLLIDGFSGELIDVRDTATVALIGQQLTFSALLADNIGTDSNHMFKDEPGQEDDGGFNEADYFYQQTNVALHVTTGLSERASDTLAPNFTPVLRSGNEGLTIKLPKGEFWDEAADYLGAIRPGIKRSWVEGWTSFPEA